MKRMVVLAVALFCLFEAKLYSQNQNSAPQAQQIVVPVPVAFSGARVKGRTEGNSVNITSNPSVDYDHAVLEVTGIPSEDRFGLFFEYEYLNRIGGALKTSAFEKNGKEEVLLHIFAPPKVVASVRNAVALYNQGVLKPGNRPPSEKYAPKYRSAAEIAQALKLSLSSVGWTYVDSAANLLLYSDHPNNMKWLGTVIPRVDVPLKKVVLEISVISVKRNSDAEKGVRWNLLKYLLPTEGALKYSGGRPATGGGLKLQSFEGVLNGISPQALGAAISAAINEGNAKVFASTKLLAVNDKSASYSTGVEQSYSLFAEKGTTNKLINETVFEGLELEVLPRIGEVQTALQISAIFTSVVGYAENGGPTVSTSRVNTTLLVDTKGGVQDFQLSGLKGKSAVSVLVGIPVIRKIPIIGAGLFSWKKTTTNDLDVFIVGRVMPEQEWLKGLQQIPE